jgi:hypothetical protein
MESNWMIFKLTSLEAEALLIEKGIIAKRLLQSFYAETNAQQNLWKLTK